jgi:DNA end-binding protein Ku
VGIGTFVMRGREYLTAILSENGVLRAETLRHSAEIRTPEAVGLPQPAQSSAKRINKFVKVIEELTRDELDMSELEDRDAHALQALARSKEEKGQEVVELAAGADLESEEGGGKVVDLMKILRRTLAKNAQVSTQDGGPTEGAGGSARSEVALRARGRARHQSGRSNASRSKADDLARQSNSALHEIAGRLDIRGRSKMDKRQLIAAIRRSENA